DEGTTASERSHAMTLEGVAARDRVNCDVGGGWPDGNPVERAGQYGDSSDVPDYSAARVSGHPELSADGAEPWPWVFGLGGLAVGAALVGAVLAIRSKTQK